MPLLAATALGLFAVGAVLTWGSNWTIASSHDDTIGALLMICSGVVLLALTLVSKSRS
jgi:hypothetical protein